MSVSLHLVLILLFSLTTVYLQEVEEVPLEVIVDSSPCSTTCGLGLKTQTLCLLKNGTAAMEENVRSKVGTEVSQECHVRRVNCVDSWHCGLISMTVTSGERVELDCLGEVMEAMGKFTWRVSWRHTRGVISSDNSLFARWETPQLDRVILDPVSEKDAGTYRCDVQDLAFRRVKRIYWGVRVLPTGVLNLDYENSLDQWETTGTHQTSSNLAVNYIVQVLLGFCFLVICCILLYCAVKRRQLRLSQNVSQ
ncbi:transmembrane protein 81 [Sphaeramia orbicularis]|uniref:transmembrane protein 81 n=1 Tax=Sphaeramia orbicularis TaxID=375764 RepID=UPI00117F570E|nr:transmembrane protein 81 [Sphaeramia orbicularis]